jgi:hypothetical protein
MKIKVNEKEILSLSETKKKVIQADIHADEFEKDCERRLCYILEHKFERCLERLKLAWQERLKERYEAIPTDPEKLADLILSQPDYKDRKTRDLEAEQRNGSSS